MGLKISDIQMSNTNDYQIWFKNLFFFLLLQRIKDKIGPESLKVSKRMLQSDKNRK